MRQPVLIAVIAIVVVGIAGGAWWYMNRTTNTNVTPVTNTVTNTNRVQNTNTAVLPPVIALKGDTTFEATTVVDGVSFHFTSMAVTTTVNGTTADAGKTYVVVYFDGLDQKSVVAGLSTMRGATLKSGTDTYAVSNMKIASNAIKGDTGYVSFTVPTTAKNFQLQLGSGASLKSIKLPV